MCYFKMDVMQPKQAEIIIQKIKLNKQPIA